MSLTGTDRGTGTHNTSATSFTLSPASNFTGGAASVALLCVAADNAAGSGLAFGTFTVSDNAGGSPVWTRRQTALIDPGAANAGHVGAIFERVGGTAMTTSTVITVSFGSDAPTAKTWTLMELNASATGGTPQYVTGNVGTGGTGTTSPTITTGTIGINHMVVAALFLEAGTTETITQDGDSTNGSWSTQQTNEIGSTTSGSNIASQRKVVTAAATQTYNPTLGILGDLCLAWVEYQEAQTVTPDLATLTTSLKVPLVRTRGGYAKYKASLAPVNWYRLGGTSGTAIDEMQHADGAYVGSPTAANSLLHDDADGSTTFPTHTDYMQVNPYTLPTAAISLESKFTAPAAPPDANAVGKWDSNSGAMLLVSSNAGGSVYFYINANEIHAVLNPSDPDYHVVGTWDGTNGRLFINGVLAAGPTAMAGPISNVSTPLGIAQYDGLSGNDQNITVDEPAVWDRRLTDAEALELYLLSNDRFVPTTAALVLTTFAPTVTASVNQLVTPSTAALATATFAPTIQHRINGASPTALVLATFAPTVTASDNKLLVPSTTALTLTTFAPVIALTVTPSTATLATSTFAPTVTAPALSTPGVTALTLTTFAPTIQTPVLTTPGPAALTLTTFAPSVSVGTVVVPTTASLATATFAPTIQTPVLVDPPAGALVLTSSAPQVLTPVTVVPAPAALALTGLAPQANLGIIVPAASLATATFAPVLALTVVPAAQSLTLTSFAPSVSTTAHVTATPSTATLALSGFSPSVTAGDAREAVPATAALTLTTFAPQVTATDHRTVTPSTATLALTGLAPTIQTPVTATPATAALVLTTFNPSIGAGTYATPGVASLGLSTFAPVVSTSDNRLAVPDLATLLLTTKVPTIITPVAVEPATAALILTGYAPRIRAGVPFPDSGSAGVVVRSTVTAGVRLVEQPTAGVVVDPEITAEVEA